MRKRHAEQELTSPNLDYIVIQERNQGIDQQPNSFSTRVSQAYSRFDQSGDLTQFNQEIARLDAEAHQEIQIKVQETA